MANMQMNKTPMKEQDPNVRNANFLEVALGYTLDEAVNEAKRCIHCKNPACVTGCPVGIPIPDFLAKVAEGDIAAAYEILSNANALPAISGRVCPQENQCEGKCVRGIKGEPVAIGRVERFVADWAAEHGVSNLATAPANGHKVAVIAPGNWPAWASPSRCSRPSTPPAACSAMASPSSVCPRPSSSVR